MLTDSQRREFGRQGYLVVEDAIDNDLVNQGQELIWDEVPEHPDDTEALVGVGSRVPDVPSEEPFMTIKQKLYEYAADLVGQHLVAPEDPSMQLALRYPGDLRLSAHVDRKPDHGHLDGYGPGFKESGEYSSWQVAAVVYFDDVVEGGGGFTVWPGSHWIAADYFSEHALNAPGYGGSLPAIDDDGGWDSDHTIDDQLRSRELNYDAGTIILWHNKLYHTSGVNQSENVRMAGIMRFSRNDQEQIYEDAADQPLKYWENIPEPK